MRTTENRSMLLFSGGQSEPNQPYYHYADSWLPGFLSQRLGSRPRVFFAAWALWAGHSEDDMFQYATEHWDRLGLPIKSLHRQPDMIKAIKSADAIIVGGGSVHMLVKALAEHKLMPPIRNQVLDGALYVGTSAGCDRMPHPTERIRTSPNSTGAVSDA